MPHGRLGQMGGGDCEDDDANAYPGAPEICNGVVDNFSGDGSWNEALPERGGQRRGLFCRVFWI